MDKMCPFLFLCLIMFYCAAHAETINTREVYLKKNNDGNFRVYINGKETPIQGAGGVVQPGMLEEFKDVGGNFCEPGGSKL